MEPMTMAAVGSSILSTGSSIFGALKGADAKKEAAKKQARFTFFQRMEDIRKMQREQAFVEGTAVAGAYASNIQMSGSARSYISDLRSEQQRQTAFARRAAKSEKRLIEKSGKSPGLGVQVLGQAASGLTSAANTYRNLTS